MSMSITEVGEVLAYIAMFDNRNVESSHILAWHQLFAETNVTKEQALNKTRKFFRRNNVRWLMPADLMPGPDDWMNQDRLD